MATGQLLAILTLCQWQWAAAQPPTITLHAMQIGGNNVCWDLEDGIIEDGTLVHLWDCDGAWNQMWMFDESTAAIKLFSDMTKCIDAGDMKDSTALKLWECNGMPQQQFGYDSKMKTVYLPSSTSTSDASKCINVAGGSLEPGTHLEVSSCNGCWNQQFSAINSDSSSLVASKSGELYSLLRNHIAPTYGATGCPSVKQHTIIKAVQIAGQNLCWDLQDGEIADGTSIHLWGCDDGWNQNWVFEAGQSSIRLAQDMSKCLDAGAMADGEILQLWTCNGLPQQRFGYDENMGTVYLSSSTSTSDASKCIDVTGGFLDAGTNLEVNDCTGCWNQQFSTVNSDSLSFLSHRTNTGIQSQSCPPKPTPPAPPSPPYGPSPYPTPSPSPWTQPPTPPTPPTPGLHLGIYADCDYMRGVGPVGLIEDFVIPFDKCEDNLIGKLLFGPYPDQWPSSRYSSGKIRSCSMTAGGSVFYEGYALDDLGCGGWSAQLSLPLGGCTDVGGGRWFHLFCVESVHDINQISPNSSRQGLSAPGTFLDRHTSSGIIVV